MENFFSWFEGVSLTFSDIKDVEDSPRTLNILLARNNGKNFDYIFTQMPELKVIESKGFSDDEVKYWMDYTLHNSFLIWEMALEKQAEELEFEKLERQESHA